MDAQMSKVVTIKLTGEEVQNLIMSEVFRLYPDLSDSVKWSWEDFSLSFNSQKLEAVALDVCFIQHSEYTDDSAETPNNEGGGI